MTLMGRDVVGLLKAVKNEMGEDRMSVYASQMAYSFFFSLFPLILFLAALMALIFDRAEVVRFLTSELDVALPPDVASVLAKTLESVVGEDGSAPGILSFGAVTALWSGSAIFGTFMGALNDAHDVDEDRPFWKKYLVRIAALAASAVVLVAATIILVNGEAVVGWIGDRVGIGDTMRTVWTIAQIPLAIAAVVLLLWGLYYFLPAVPGNSKKYALVAAVVATVLWILATLLFRLYVQKFHTMNPSYGAIGAIMVLLTWMFFSSFVLLAAGELNAELEHGTARVGADSAHRTRVEERKARKKANRERRLGRRGAGDARDAERERAVAASPRGNGSSGVHRPAAAFASAAHASHPEPGSARDHHGAMYPTHVAAVGPAAAERRRIAGVREELTAAADGRRGFGAILKDLLDGGAALVRRELDLARIELAAAIRAMGVGTVMVGFGGVLALLGVLALFTGLILLPGDQWMKDQYWLAALVVTAIAAGLGAWFAKKGMALLAPSALAPTETAQTIKEDIEWLRLQKARMTSDTTLH